MGELSVYVSVTTTSYESCFLSAWGVTFVEKPWTRSSLELGNMSPDGPGLRVPRVTSPLGLSPSSTSTWGSAAWSGTRSRFVEPTATSSRPSGTTSRRRSFSATSQTWILSSFHKQERWLLQNPLNFQLKPAWYKTILKLIRWTRKPIWTHLTNLQNLVTSVLCLHLMTPTLRSSPQVFCIRPFLFFSLSVLCPHMMTLTLTYFVQVYIVVFSKIL